MADGLTPTSDVGPVESAADAAARLRLASAQLFAVSEWLARGHLLDRRVDEWCDLADSLGHEARALARRIRMVADE